MDATDNNGKKEIWELDYGPILKVSSISVPMGEAD